MIDHEKSVIIGYILKLLEGPCNKSAFIKEICEYLESDQALLEGKMEELTDLLEPFQEQLASKNSLLKKTAQKISYQLVSLLTERQQDLFSSKPGLLENNLSALAQHLKLDALERGFLGLTLRHQAYGHFSSFFNDVSREHQNTIELCARSLGAEPEDLFERLRPAGRLLSSGVLVQSSGSGSDLDDSYQVLDQALSAMQRIHGGMENLLEAILGKPSRPALNWSDFEHLGNLRERLVSFLTKAVEEKIAGVNILFWGPPGTGKTEFCKAVAARVGLKLYAVGEEDDEGDEPNRRERMSSYRLSQNLLRYQSDALLMFDEMDDLFEGQALARLFGIKMSIGSKVFMNRVLESNPIPTFWIINDVGMLDEAFIRRMNLAIELKVPPASSRERVWRRVLEKNAVELPDQEMRSMVDLNLPPAVFDSAARFTRQIGGSAEDFKFAAQGIVQAMRCGKPLSRPEVFAEFSPELTCADLDLETLTERLSSAGTKAFSLCLYGPPGTGKSAYVRYLAGKLNLSVLMKRASDLMNPYVGETEKSIAEAFKEAQEKEAFLVFDEADSLLGDRRYAQRSWEVSQVNEMLTWMESHPLPFACTTNLMDRLDQASLRRFTLKCHLDYLSAEKIKAAFKGFFELEAPEEILPTLNGLTPGDFVLTGKKARLLGIEKDLRQLVALLEKELEVKGIKPARQVGFANH